MKKFAQISSPAIAFRGDDVLKLEEANHWFLIYFIQNCALHFYFSHFKIQLYFIHFKGSLLALFDIMN